MTTIYLHCTAILLLFSSVKGAPQYSSDVAENFKNWAKEKLLGAIDDLHVAQENLKTAVRKAIEDNKRELEIEYMNQLDEYHTHKQNLHPLCFETGLTELNNYAILSNSEMEMLSAKDLFEIFADPPPTPVPHITTTPAPNCVTIVFQDVGLMIYKVSSYVALIIVTLDDIINGYQLCAKTALEKFTCIFTYAGTAVMDVYHVIKDAIVLVREMIDLGKHMKDEIARCLHPKKEEIRQMVMLALNNAQNCTQKYKLKY